MKKTFNVQVLLLLLAFPLAGFGFNLAVTHTEETCPGNGSLNFTVTNADPNGSILFVVYKLPNLTTPYASGAQTFLNGLAAGDYRVIARETVAGVITTQQQDVTITSSFSSLSYTVQALNQACSATSSISIIVISGTAASYAIINGPVLFPPQSSNIFSGLTVGVYKVQVTDTCGNSVVQTFTVTLYPAGLAIDAPELNDTNPPSCSMVVATNTITAATGTVIGYPLQLHYILHLPSGDNDIYTNLLSGNVTLQPVSQTIPYLINQSYTYDLIITDACGTTYPASTFVVNHALRLTAGIVIIPCNQYSFLLNSDHFVDSYTLQFTNFPAGFTPLAFNSAYPGPFTQPRADFGNGTPPVPFGDYTVTSTDTCGKTATTQFSIIVIPPVPTIIGTNNGCIANNGKIEARIPGYMIVTAVVTAAPSGYPFALPNNVTASLTSEGVLILDPVPLGDYTIEITDDCGDILEPLTVTVPTYVSQGINIEVSPGCDIGRAAVKIQSNNGRLTSAIITAAPASFPFPLPYDISNNIISGGQLYMAGLPTGSYTFSVIDSCGIVSNQSEVVSGYSITANTFSLTVNCGSFNIPLNFVNNSIGEIFGLQRLLDAATNTWGNPITGEVYTEGTIINDANSYLLQNNATNFNLTFNGVFRIVHYFRSYNNGSELNSGAVTTSVKKCIEILSPTLTFNNALSINDISRVPCSQNGNLDVLLFTNGTPPLNYRIIEKNGVPFAFNNGTSAVFLNITPGIYKFEVEDSCGNTVNRTFDVSDLASLVTIFPVCDLFNCATTITGNETFDLSQQNAVILGNQLPDDYTLAYYTSPGDAASNSNPITNLTSYNPTTNPQMIYIRLSFNQLPDCYESASFNLITGQKPRTDLETEYIACNSQPIVLDASIGNLPITTYAWSSGEITPSISISNVGITTVSVTATNSYGSCSGVAFGCTTSGDISVTIPLLPEIDHIDSEDWTDNENSITVVTTQPGAFEYSLDGITYQDSPTFNGLRAGLFTIFVRDITLCTTVIEEVWLLNYPKFFTPNGDGYNDSWYIKDSENEPELHVYLFDRYGKLITNILSNGTGWNGTVNGKLLFSDDYWFVAHRQDGRILRGHFTLKR